MPTTRPLQPADIPTLLALAESLAHMHRALDPRRFNWTADLRSAYRAWFERALTDNSRFVFVAEHDARIVGYAMGEALAEDTTMWSPAHAFIHDITVAEPARHTGAGSALVNAVAAWARAKGLTQIRAITANENPGAASFFTRAGFRPVVTERLLEL